LTKTARQQDVAAGGSPGCKRRGERLGWSKYCTTFRPKRGKDFGKVPTPRCGVSGGQEVSHFDRAM
jgi:hypothetical protein